MKKIVLIMLMFFGMMNLTIAQSQPKMVSVPESELTEQQKQKIYTQQTVQNASEWVGLGKEIGEAFNGALSALTKNASEFADTSLGRFAMYMVAFKIIGAPIIGFFFLFIWFIVSTILYFIYIKNNVLERKIVDKEKFNDAGKVIERVYRQYEPDGTGAVTFLSAVIYIVSNVIISLIVLSNIF